MIALKCPKMVRTIADSINDLYPDVTFKTIVGIVSYFMLSKKSIFEAVRDLAYLPSASTMSRGMKEIKPNRFMKRMRASILRNKNINKKDWVFILDDTSNPNHGKFYRSGYWGSSGGVYRGQKVMVLAMVNLKTHQAIPIDYHLVPKRKSDRSPKMNYYAYYMIRKALRDGFPKLDVVADSWFDGVAFIACLERAGLNFIFQFKSTRKVKLNPGPYVPWVSLTKAFSKLRRNRVKTDWDTEKVKKGHHRGKAIAELHLQIRNRSKSLKAIAVYERRNSKKAFGYYASTDQSMSGTRIWMISRARWSIEVIFRCCKQYLSFGKLSCQGKDAAHLSVAMPLYLFYKLTEACPKIESMPKYLGRIQEQAFTDGIDTIMYRPNSKSVKRLKARRNPDRAHRKPCNTYCGKSPQAA